MSHLGPTLRRKRRPVSAARRIALAAALSLVVNLLFLLRLDLSWLDSATAPRRAVAVAPLTARDWEKNRAVAVAPKAPPPPADAGGQVVSIAPPPEERRAKEATGKDAAARFRTEFDSQVDKETKSRHATGDYAAVAPVPAAPVAGGRPGRADARPDAAEAVEQRRRLALAWRPSEAVQRELAEAGRAGADRPEQRPVPGPRGEPGHEGLDSMKPRYDLRPGARIASVLAGPASDHLPDVEEGEGTFLNAKEWRYAGYFNRIGESIVMQWRGGLQDEVAARDPTGQRFLYKDRIAVVDVTLDDHGKVTGLRLTRSTGVDFLDRVAVDMFRRADTFSNPPKGIVDERGQINFAYGINFVGVTPTTGLLRAPRFRE